MLAGAFRRNAASPVPTPTTKAKCRSICQGDWRNTCSKTSPRIAPVPRHSTRRFDPSSTTRSGEDNQTPIGSRSRWGQRGDVRDALDGSLWTALGAGNGPPSFLSRGIALLSGHRQTNRLYRRMRIGAAQQKFSWSSGERFLAPGYGCVPRAEWFCQYITTVLPNGAHFWYKGDDGL